MSRDTSRPGGETPSRKVGALEWGVAAFGAALVVGVLGVLIQEAVTYGDGPPVIVASVVDVTPTASGYVVRLRADNRGSTTAAEVRIVGALKDAGRTVEEADVTLDYVARKSSREAGLVFQRDPSTATLELRATSYRKP